jgi:hypothetical protein
VLRGHRGLSISTKIPGQWAGPDRIDRGRSAIAWRVLNYVIKSRSSTAFLVEEKIKQL